MKKQRTSFSLSPECKTLTKLLSEKLGISQASIIEMAVRKLAEAENINKE